MLFVALRIHRCEPASLPTLSQLTRRHRQIRRQIHFTCSLIVSLDCSFLTATAPPSLTLYMRIPFTRHPQTILPPPSHIQF